MTASSAFPWLTKIMEAPDAKHLRCAMATENPGITTVPTSLIIIGAAEEGQRLGSLCEAAGIEIVAVADDNPMRQGEIIGGKAVVPTSSLGGCERSIPVIIASHRVLKAAQRMQAAGFICVAPFAALQVLHGSVFPPHAYHDGLLEDLIANRQRIKSMAEKFADDKSRQVLDAVLAYRQTLHAAALAPVVDWELYRSDDLSFLGQHDVYVDGGTYDGDSIQMFIDRTGGKFDRVLGFEPDPTTFSRLKKNFESEPRVEPINAGLYDRPTTLRFHDGAGRGSILTETGTIEVPVTSLDSVLQGARATIIKMNIEGAELKALEGARETILKWKPTLLISAYHRPSDLWQVAEVINNIRNDYDIYLRQYDGGIIETVVCALP